MNPESPKAFGTGNAQDDTLFAKANLIGCHPGLDPGSRPFH